MITFKKCEQIDLDLLHKIAIQSYNDTYQYLWKDKGKSYLERFYKKEIFKEELSAADIFYFLIYNGENAVGFVKLKENTIESYAPSKCIELDKLYLLKEAIGKGIGKSTMNFVISFSKEKNYAAISLKVMESSPAKFVYEKAGFVQIDQYDLDYPNIVEEHASILTMVCKI
ncbi:GNAT family N-acetyltransferase [Flavobacterium sp. 17A]|uniref:GNAT family N-acetyltransferase n=1 Tax=Flavobacterium potami TaxID=2872310 RepID=A0A9X1KQF4_9FLAO|nr:GNAT family N-acetyltransferase [Flavobacterium potami]MBZ4035425.1 GNAT family N-acetyltransferase [Flavobacterium potami]